MSMDSTWHRPGTQSDNTGYSGRWGPTTKSPITPPHKLNDLSCNHHMPETITCGPHNPL